MKLAKLALPQLLGLLVLVGTAAAAVTLTYSTHSTQSLAVKAAPVVFEAGADAAPSDYVPAFSLTTNRTAYSADLRGVPEASVTIDDLVHLKNVDTRPHAVILTGASDANPYVTTYRLDLMSGTMIIGTLDLKSASPSLHVTLAPGDALTTRVTIELASGAGNDNVADTMLITTTIAS